MYHVSLETVSARPLAGIRVRMPVAQVPSSFRGFLSSVYDTARRVGLSLDGLNVFMYEGADAQALDVTFGVGVSAPFPPQGSVVFVQTPPGEVARVTHWGEYSELGRAHAAIHEWCASHGRTFAGHVGKPTAT